MHNEEHTKHKNLKTRTYFLILSDSRTYIRDALVKVKMVKFYQSVMGVQNVLNARHLQNLLWANWSFSLPVVRKAKKELNMFIRSHTIST